MIPTTPALYEATVQHARQQPIKHRFRYRTFYALTDIDDPPASSPWARYDRPGDHLDIRAELRRHGIEAARILRLATPRAFGHAFNPISVHWCYGADGSAAATVAEVHNTYGGRHAYVLRPDATGAARTAKRLYVSPFYPVDGEYSIRVGEPGESLAVAVTLHRPGDAPFVAAVHGRRAPYTNANLLKLTARYPAAPLRVSTLIRRQGIELWARGLKVCPR